MPMSCGSRPISAGLPGFNVVGLPDAGVRESRERVRAAIINSGFEFPAGRITVNLSPADLPKESGRFDLPIALGLLLASGQLPEPPSAGDAGGKPSAMPASESMLARLVLAGELSLTGALTPVTAPLLIALGVARDQPDATLVLPAGSAEQAAWSARPARAVGPQPGGRGGAHHGRACPARRGSGALARAAARACLSDVRGQPAARRALEVAAAGGHSLLMVGPGGRARACWRSGCRACCRRCRAGRRWRPRPWRRWPAMRRRPLGSRHSGRRIIPCPCRRWWAAAPIPGLEISLAHHGVLFLDELPEFNRRTLESLREPLETGRVLISRAMRTARFPARFQLVAAMNPCPCGWRGHPVRACACTPDQVARYAEPRLGPCWTASTCICACRRWPGRAGRAAGEASAAVRERVLACRGRQLERQDKPNAALAGAELDRHCALDESGRELLLQPCAACAARPACCTGRCGWRARSPTWKARNSWAPGMSRRRCSTGRSERRGVFW